MGKLIGKTRTLTINGKLKELLQGDYVLIGNGVNKLKKKKEFKFISKKILGPLRLESNYFTNTHYDKKINKKLPKIIYPYSPTSTLTI